MTLPCEPLEYITRQTQGDWCVLDQRDGNLWMDAGMVTTQADWSLNFDPGMNFIEWHGPVPLAPEQYPYWGKDRGTVTAENVGELVHLRVEFQGLWRLPRSNAIVFSIHAYLISMQELVTIPKWSRRMHRVLKSLHPALVDYKGLTRFRDTVGEWLSKYDDGAPTPPGMLPE